MPTSSADMLNNDILLSIFDIVTSTIPLPGVQRKDRPLTVIRIASQVCRQWRELMLDSSWIWGRLIDLACCGQEEDKWMEEVARRSGSAPLWIYGEIAEFPANSVNLRRQGYFIQRLDSWARVEKLSVIIYLDHKQILDHLQIRFLSRAPILKLFDVDFLGLAGTLFLDTLRPGSSKRLFADYAPFLRSFRARNMAVGLDSPWLSNIREIYPFPEHLTLENIFAILQRTPIIESIRIQNSGLLLVQAPSFKLALPNLSSIFLVTSLSAIAALLNHIIPAKLSSFLAHVQNCQISNLNLSFILSAFKENLPSFISNYFTANSPTILHLAFSRRHFRVSDVTTGIPEHYPQSFQVSMGSREPHDHWNNLAACLLDVLAASSILQGSPSIFQSITGLKIYFHGRQPSSLIAKLYSVLTLLQNVQNIHTNEMCAHALFALTRPDVASNDPQSILFPQLHTLHLDTGYIMDGVIHTDLTQFITWRKNIGFPIAKLDLTQCKQSNYAQDLRDLEAVDGLEVVWKKQGDEGRTENCSYICGTGEPEHLKGLVSKCR